MAVMGVVTSKNRHEKDEVIARLAIGESYDVQNDWGTYTFSLEDTCIQREQFALYGTLTLAIEILQEIADYTALVNERSRQLLKPAIQALLRQRENIMSGAGKDD